MCADEDIVSRGLQLIPWGGVAVRVHAPDRGGSKRQRTDGAHERITQVDMAAETDEATLDMLGVPVCLPTGQIQPLRL